MIYVYRLLRLSDEDIENNDIQCLHLSFENNLIDDIKLLIAEFIILYQFYIGKQAEDVDCDDGYIKTQISQLQYDLSKLNICPEGASGKNGGNRIYKKWKSDKEEILNRIEFLEKMPPGIQCIPASIINVQRKTFFNLLDIFNTRPICVDVNSLDKQKGKVVLNDSSLNEIKGIKIDDEYLLKLIHNITLFDCESSVKKNADFNFDNLSKLNNQHNTNFQSLNIISFNKGDRNSQNADRKIDLIRKRFLFPVGSSYSITSHEVASLLEQQYHTELRITFWGENSSTFWDIFLLETGIRELYELKSIGMLNVYSLCFNEEIKNYVLDDIFSQDEKSIFLTSETKQVILETSDEVIASFKDSLSQTIDFLIQSNWWEAVLGRIKKKSWIVIPEIVIKDYKFKNMIVEALELSDSKFLVSWNDIEFNTDRRIFILAYRDQGRYPYYFYPNLLENEFRYFDNVQAIFLNNFFKLKYDWAIFNLNKSRYKTLSHNIRDKHFRWKELGEKIKTLKPQKHDSTIWDLENEYSNTESRPSVKVKYQGLKRIQSYVQSDLFIVRYDDDAVYKVERIQDIADTDLSEVNLSIQHLEVIQNDINIYEKFYDINKQEEELKIIRSQFNIDDKEAGRLWKVLLNEMGDDRGIDTLYQELKIYFGKKELKMVSFGHFKNTWINPESASLTPLQKKVFVSLCDFLGIPKSYFIIMQRIKNASKQASRQSTRQMNFLLKDL
ncbi:MAG: hypothetical protein RQ856_06390, partial [Candidatus Izemoplasmatales bacterium]|nr:hypothetical protein [Candidatus Izemoplasmatales bacterium]